MSNYVISCESTADLSKEYIESRDIKYICFHYEIDGKQYADDLGQTMSFPDFYQIIRDGGITKTSQINITEYEEFFSKFAAEGKNIIHLSLSSGISGTVNSASQAAELVKEKYPNVKIFVIDSLAASSGYGLLMDKVADLRDEGMAEEKLVEWVETNKKRLHHWFFSSDLTTYIRGGRISKAAGVFGGLLEICPLMNVDFMGRLIPREKIRTKKRVIKEIEKKMVEHAENGKEYSGKCFISMSDCLEDAKEVAALVEADFPKLNGKVMINWIGTTIGSHTGPGTVALFFWGDERVD